MINYDFLDSLYSVKVKAEISLENLENRLESNTDDVKSKDSILQTKITATQREINIISNLIKNYITLHS